ncbi:hypothetical protein EJ06DRAFT_355756 [Trichodelitschia bisporula]|uniref:Uncharacterized protein n=1 Tax=Trichodelitschia bisporula TaxID=703511 RepID=A0A6G1I0V7_9PEZI|nr:hypothetical protein EJ06DRAFT_355756 [Trichodelitschia bisporula]
MNCESTLMIRATFCASSHAGSAQHMSGLSMSMMLPRNINSWWQRLSVNLTKLFSKTPPFCKWFTAEAVIIKVVTRGANEKVIAGSFESHPSIEDLHTAPDNKVGGDKVLLHATAPLLPVGQAFELPTRMKVLDRLDREFGNDISRVCYEPCLQEL